jgi:hypothetical protein
VRPSSESQEPRLALAITECVLRLAENPRQLRACRQRTYREASRQDCPVNPERAPGGTRASPSLLPARLGTNAPSSPISCQRDGPRRSPSCQATPRPHGHGIRRPRRRIRTAWLSQFGLVERLRSFYAANRLVVSPCGPVPRARCRFTTTSRYFTAGWKALPTRPRSAHRNESKSRHLCLQMLSGVIHAPAAGCGTRSLHTHCHPRYLRAIAEASDARVRDGVRRNMGSGWTGSRQRSRSEHPDHQSNTTGSPADRDGLFWRTDCRASRGRRC